MFIQKNYLPKIKDGACVTTLDEFKSIGTHWIDLYLNGNNKRTPYDTKYFYSFVIEHIQKQIKKFIENKNNNKYLRNKIARFDKVWILFLLHLLILC